MSRTPLTIVFLAVILGADAFSAEPKHGEFPALSLTVRGTTREHRLVVSKTIDLAKPAPLVVAFHGMLIDSKDLMPKYTKLNDTAEKHRFIVAYPNALDKSWGLFPDKVERTWRFSTRCSRS